VSGSTKSSASITPARIKYFKIASATKAITTGADTDSTSVSGANCLNIVKYADVSYKLSDKLVISDLQMKLFYQDTAPSTEAPEQLFSLYTDVLADHL